MTRDEIYSRVPRLDCKGLCAMSCGPIPVARIEWAAMGFPTPAEDCGDTIIVGPRRKSLDCPLLVDGRCTNYTNRPLICRTWGVSKDLPCKWGCRPKHFMKRKLFDKLFGMLKGMTTGVNRKEP